MAPLAVLILLVLAAAGNASKTTGATLWQTNSTGDDVHVIDVATFELVKRLVVGRHPHGIGVSPDERTVFVLPILQARPGSVLW